MATVEIAAQGAAMGFDRAAVLRRAVVANTPDRPSTMLIYSGYNEHLHSGRSVFEELGDQCGIIYASLHEGAAERRRVQVTRTRRRALHAFQSDERRRTKTLICAAVAWSYMGTLKLPKLKCNRCGHKWFPRQEREPKSCPKCHSPYWNKPRDKRHSKNKR